MLSLVLFLVLAAAVSYFVALPLLSPHKSQFKADSNHKANDLVERKEAIYAAIKEIEFDYQMGKLSEADFKELRQQYKDEAIGLLGKIDQVQEKAVKAKDVHATKKPKGGAQPGVKFCWLCGTSVTKGDAFCVSCGNKIE